MRWLRSMTLLLVMQAGWAHVSAWQLDNGLTVWFLPDHRAPLVLTQVWYRVGSADESLGHTGISHMLEHMLFLGTKKWPKGAYDRAISDMGGASNAMTSYDATMYYSQVPVAHFADVLAMEADRMRHLVFDETLFQRERGVVQEERRMRLEDRPSALAQERYRAHAFLSSPYHHMTIGWMGDIEQYTLSDCKAWYDRWYWPNHATLVIVGDLEEAQVREQVQKAFGGIAKQTQAVVGKKTLMAPQLGALSQTMAHPLAKVEEVMMGVVVPSVGSATIAWEPYALRLLAAVLSEGHASLLDQRLRYEQKQVLSIGVGYNPLARLDTDFTVYATPAKGVDGAKLQAKVAALIEQVAQQGVDEAALQRARAQVMASHVFAQDSWQERGMLMGRLALLGQTVADYEAFSHRLEAVTGQQIQSVAAKYFKANRWVQVLLQPMENA